MQLSIEFAPLEKRLRQARKEGLIRAEYLGEQIPEAEKAQVISKAEANGLRDYHEKVAALLDVDEFPHDGFLHRKTGPAPDEGPTKPAKKVAKKKAARKPAAKKATRKKTSKKKTAKA